MIKRSTVIRWITIIVFLFLGASNAYNLVSIKGLTGYDYNLTFPIGLILAFSLHNSHRRKDWTLSKEFRTYYVWNVISIATLVVYTIMTYSQQSLYLTFRVASQYLLVIWAVPIYYLMRIDNTEAKIMESVNLLAVIWCSLLLVHSIYYNTTGGVLFDFIDSASSGLRNEHLRVSTGCLTNVSLIYCFWKMLSNEPKRKKYHMCCFAIMVAALIYVMQSRAYTVAMSIVLIVMIIFDRNSLRNFTRKTVLVLVIVAIAFGTDFIQSYFHDIFTRYEISVTARTYGYSYYWNVFLKNPVFGFGLLKDQEHYSLIYSGSLGLAFMDDVGIVGQLAELGIFCLLIVVGMYLYLIKTYWKFKKTNGTNTFLLGLLTYLIATSATLIVFDQQRVCIVALAAALFEFYLNHDSTNIKTENIGNCLEG